MRFFSYNKILHPGCFSVRHVSLHTLTASPLSWECSERVAVISLALGIADVNGRGLLHIKYRYLHIVDVSSILLISNILPIYHVNERAKEAKS